MRRTPRHDERHTVTKKLVALRRRRAADKHSEAMLVARARAAGMSWGDIAEALGETRSAVWKRHHEEID